MKMTGETKLFIFILVGAAALVGAVVVPTLRQQQLDMPKLPPPQPNTYPLSMLAPPGSHVLGPKNAPFTLVEFGDYQCPICRTSTQEVKAIMEQHPTQLKLVFRNFPLPMHNRAKPAAYAAEAAGLQGKFWPMHDLLYENQPNFSHKDFDKYAQELGLDVAQFNRDIKSEAVKKRVEEDIAAGQQFDVTSTPSFWFVPPDISQERRIYTPGDLLTWLADPNHWVVKSAPQSKKPLTKAVKP
ncbi:MAG: DsbA family protein [Armatimonadetes bacterium]|nr:DsbA family protein [Armatimonadota bacterium]